jgi:Holliday junction resolvase
MSESIYQAKEIRKLEKKGWYCLRLIQTNKNGIPDYLVMKKRRKPYFIEFKARGEKPDPLQEYRHKEILERTGIMTRLMIEP